MAINIFEGARRIAWLITGASVIGFIAVVSREEPYVSIRLATAQPDAPFIRIESECPPASASEFITRKTSFGHSINLELCFTPMRFSSGDRLLVPYKVDSNSMIWGDERYSDHVGAYTKEKAFKFKLSGLDEAFAEKRYSSRKWQDIKESATYLSYALAAFWFAVFAIGWIVRGFLGIPYGRDKRLT